MKFDNFDYHCGTSRKCSKL